MTAVRLEAGGKATAGLPFMCDGDDGGGDGDGDDDAAGDSTTIALA